MAMALMVSVAFGQSNAFKQLAQIEGVEHVSINKSMLDMVAKSGGDLDFGENLSVGGMSGDILKKMESLSIYHCEAKEAAENLSTQVKRILGGRGWEPLVNANGDDGRTPPLSFIQKKMMSQL